MGLFAWKAAGCTCGTVGVILLLFGAIVPPVVIDKMVEEGLEQNCHDGMICIPNTGPGTWQFENWATNENATVYPPEYWSFTMYNITNHAAVVHDNATIEQELLGPFVYRLHREKFDVEYGQNSSEVFFQNSQWFEFVPELSTNGERNFTQDEEVIGVSFDITSGCNLIAHISGEPCLSQSFLLAMACEEPNQLGPLCFFSKRSIQDLLFGYDSEILTLLQGETLTYDNFFAIQFNCTDPAQCATMNSVKHNYGLAGNYNLTANNCFYEEETFLSNYNTCADPITYAQEYNMTTPPVQHKALTGYWNREDVAKLDHWLGNEYIAWETPIKVEGSEGFMFPPGHIESDKPLTVFEDQILRPVDLVYDSDTKVLDVDTMRFRLEDSFFTYDPKYVANGTTSEEQFNMLYPGYFNTSTTAFTRYGLPTPVWFSKVFGIGTSEAARNTTKCHNCPNPDNLTKWDHTTFIDVQPDTGRTLRAQKVAQVNLEIGQEWMGMGDPEEDPWHWIPKAVVPVLVLNQTSSMEDQQQKVVKDGLDQLAFASTMRKAVLFGGCIGGSILILASFAIFYKAIRSSRESTNYDYVRS